MRARLRTLVACLCVWAAPAHAEDGTYKQQLEQVNSDIQSAQQGLAKKQQAREAERQALTRLERDIAKRRNNIRAIKKRLKRAQRELADVQYRQREEGRKRQKDQDTLAQQIRAMHKLGEAPQIKLLLHIDDPSDISRLLTYYGYISRSRDAEIKAADARLGQLKQLNRETQQRRTALQQQSQALDAEFEQVKQLQRQRGQRLAKLEGRIQESRESLDVLKSQRQELQRLLERLRRAAKAKAKAKVAKPPPKSPPRTASTRGGTWPTRGEVVAVFNALRNTQSRARWQGILIAAPQGTDVQAVKAGEVVFSDWLNGYGYLCIVDHGDQYMTLYAHNESILPELGEQVAAGEVIATVGQSGSHKEAGLYFEVRRNSVAVDPIPWLKKL